MTLDNNVKLLILAVSIMDVVAKYIRQREEAQEAVMSSTGTPTRYPTHRPTFEHTLFPPFPSSDNSGGSNNSAESIAISLATLVAFGALVAACCCRKRIKNSCKKWYGDDNNDLAAKLNPTPATISNGEGSRSTIAVRPHYGMPIVQGTVLGVQPGNNPLTSFVGEQQNAPTISPPVP